MTVLVGLRAVEGRKLTDGDRRQGSARRVGFDDELVDGAAQKDAVWTALCTPDGREQTHPRHELAADEAVSWVTLHRRHLLL